MIVQYASDLHLEFEVNRRVVLEGGIKPAGDVLVLAGDVANLFALSSYDAFWDWCAKNWAQTIFVPGPARVMRVFICMGERFCASSVKTSL